MKFRRSLRAAALFLVLAGVSAARLNAAETPIPPPPARWVTDTANFMSPGAQSSLDSRLAAYGQSTGHQLIVYIGQTTGDAPIDDWAVRAFERWKVGRKGIDDGLVLFIMAADRKLRIEVGYGLEAQVPDAIASRVINEVIVPRIQAGDRDGAVTSGMDAVMMVIGGGALPAGRSRRERQPMPLAQFIFLAIIGVIALVMFLTNPSLAMLLLFNIFSGGGRRDRDDWGGGGGWGGGGFSGGGGRSGGGGASGSW